MLIVLVLVYCQIRFRKFKLTIYILYLLLVEECAEPVPGDNRILRELLLSYWEHHYSNILYIWFFYPSWDKWDMIHCCAHIESVTVAIFYIDTCFSLGEDAHKNRCFFSCRNTKRGVGLNKTTEKNTFCHQRIKEKKKQILFFCFPFLLNH